MIQAWDRVHFRTAVWYYDIRDFINDNGITAPGSGAGSNCLYNIDSVKLYGFEIEAALQLSPVFRITAAYVFQEHDAARTGFEQDWTYYLPATLPRHKVKVLAGYEIIPEGWVQLSARFVGGRDAQKGARPSGSPFNGGICADTGPVAWAVPSLGQVLTGGQTGPGPLVSGPCGR